MCLTLRRSEETSQLHRALLTTLCISYTIHTGYPDHATRGLLQMVVASAARRGVCLPVFAVTDADPHGVAIAMCYADALQHAGFRWIGVYPSQLGRMLHLPSSAILTITQREHCLARSLLQRCAHNVPPLNKFFEDASRELHAILEASVKFEIEALACMQCRDESVLLQYIVQQIAAIFG